MNYRLFRNEILTITSFPPRACGIATYSQDLLDAMNLHVGNQVNLTVCALEDGRSQYKYDWNRVTHILDTSIPEAYAALGRAINKDNAIKAVFLQHEFGLYGGHYGQHLRELLGVLQKPVIVTFHTVLPQPESERLAMVQEIVNQSYQVIVMTQTSATILRDQYGIDEEHIRVIPHGTHQPPMQDRARIREQLKVDDKLMLATFGLLSPNKSIETALDAMPAIIRQYPQAMYYILGKTHPGIVQQQGEQYRESLEQKVQDLGIGGHVRFVNQYLGLDELLQYLVATDVYLFTSKDRNQAVSGTFAYAMSAGCPVITTAIPHAREWIDQDTGIIVDFEQPDQVAKATMQLLADDHRRIRMSESAQRKIQPTYWATVAEQTAGLFTPLLKRQPTSAGAYPPVSLQHLQRLTTDIGVIQFSKYSIPDPTSGYTLDDNARALIVTLRHFELFRDASVLSLMDTYLQYIADSQQPDGKFLNYRDEQGNAHAKNEYVNLEDANGRAIMALGQLLSSSLLLPTHMYAEARKMVNSFLPHIPGIQSPRSIAFLIKGLYQYNLAFKSMAIQHLIEVMADRLVQQYEEISSDNWQWFEKYLTYGNSTMPEAMLYAYLATKKPAFKIIAKTTFDFLLSQIFRNGQIKVISNKGWYHMDTVPHEYGEQPIDVAYTIEALDTFYDVFHLPAYRTKMDVAFSWFTGNNHLQQSLYNHATGGCYDGLEDIHINLNQGAESTVCYLMARLTMEKLLKRDTTPAVREPYFPTTIRKRQNQVATAPATTNTTLQE